MNESFTIIDYTTDVNGVSTVIDEPVGWDAISLHIMRDKNWHGFFNAIDDTVASLQFVGTGFTILQNAYELKGLEADVKLLIEFQCSDGDAYQQLYYGQFVFAKFKSQCGDLCMVECGVEAVDCMMLFRNRYDQRVDLDSLRWFDGCNGIDLTGISARFELVTKTIRIFGIVLLTDIVGQYLRVSNTALNNGTYLVVSVTTVAWDTIIEVAESLIDETPTDATFYSGCMVPYAGLNMPMVLPGKTIRLESKWKSRIDNAYTYILQNPLPFGYRVALTPDWENQISEIENTLVGEGYFIDADPLGGGSGPAPDYGSFTGANPPDYLIYFTGGVNSSSVVCVGPVALRMSFEYALGSTTVHPTIDAFKLYVVKDIAFRPPYTGQTVGPNQWVFDLTIDFNINHLFDQTINFDIAVGETVWIWFDISASAGIGGENFILQLTKESFFDMKIDSSCSTTNTNVYMLNEVMSRCVEAYTNDCMRVFSNYFGRTDALPYPSDVDGCGGLRSISNGKKIRNAPNTDADTDTPTPIKMTVSMKDTFEALNATDNIGMGLEADPNRPGDNLIRVEPVHYFFNDTVLMSCLSIREVRREVDQSIVYSNYKGGYMKWETWNANGLFDLFADRQYRTSLSQLSNTLVQTCAWIASDYAIEFTRRLYGTTTSDWKFDYDIFFLCLLREQYNYNVGGSFVIQGSVELIALQGNSYLIKAGDSIIITGTVSNDGTYTVAWVGLAPFGGTFINVVESIVAESFVNFNIQSAASQMQIEQGIDSPANILFPDSVMNYRIAPSRNAMRWAKTIFQSYRDASTSKLIFTQGGGNILGQGEVLNADGCRLENQAIQEQEDLGLSLFLEPEENSPNFRPELITFDYPMGYQEYLSVIANPYGLIGYQCGSADVQYGWIEDMKYTPYTGMVTFTLRPKIET